MATNTVYIVSSARTPLGSFRGSLSELTAVQLAAVAIKGAIERSNVPVDAIDEVVFGNVVQAGSGANVARQSALAAGLKSSTIAVTVNKVCASGMKAILIGTQMIRAGDAEVVVAGGTESMSNAPYYLKRGETPYGGVNLTDGLLVDGLLDPFKNGHSGDCAENTAKVQQITREQQDDFCIQSYERAQAAQAKGLLAKEIVPVTIAGKRGKPDVVVSEDEEPQKVVFQKIRSLNPVFKKDGSGTITAANASSINDGAAAVVLASEAAVQKYGLKPLAKIIGYADAATESIDFPIAPAAAVQKILKKTGIGKEEIAHWEVNEAFSVVALANAKLLSIDQEKLNPNGGGVSIGHPLGCSGARITGLMAIHLTAGQYGCASICNGGGGAAAILIQKL